VARHITIGLMLVGLAGCANQLAQHRDEIDGLKVVFEGDTPKARYVQVQVLDPDLIEMEAMDTYELQGGREVAQLLSTQEKIAYVKATLQKEVGERAVQVFPTSSTSSDELRVSLGLYGWVRGPKSAHFFTIATTRIVLGSTGEIWRARKLGLSRAMHFSQLRTMTHKDVEGALAEAIRAASDELTAQMMSDAIPND
jgi:hypothetical protein